MVLQQRFRQRVNALLVERAWSQSELGRRMGVASSYVNVYLTGKVSPGLDVVERFADALEVDPKEFFEETHAVA